MKNFKKYTSWITSAILGITTIVFGSLFINSFRKNKDYESIIKNSIGKKEINLKINVDALDNNEDTQYIYNNVKSLKDNNKIKTLQDFMLAKEDTYKLGVEGDFGRMVEWIKGKSSKWVKAIYSQGSWWKITSSDYGKIYPKSIQPGSEEGLLNVGVASIYLTNDFEFTFTETPA